MKIALTFDDGPNLAWTPILLGLLKAHQIKATFFMVGKWVAEQPKLTQLVAEHGHKIGNHTMTHPKLTELPSLEHVKKELVDCEEILTKTVGPHSKLFRPPYIATSYEIELAATGLGLIPVFFKAAGGDAVQRGAEFIFNKVKKELGEKSGIVLLHDGSHEAMGADRRDTFYAVELLIKHFKKLGADFVFPLEVD